MSRYGDGHGDMEGLVWDMKEFLLHCDKDEWESPIQKLLSLVKDAIGDYEYEKSKEG